MEQARQRSNSRFFYRVWFPVARLHYASILLLVANGCSKIPNDLPSSPGLDATGIWLPFWLVAIVAAVAVPIAFYFGWRRLSQPFLKYLFLIFVVFVGAEAALLGWNGFSVAGQVFGEIPWLTRRWADHASESVGRTDSTENQPARSGTAAHRGNSPGDSADTSQHIHNEASEANEVEQVRADFAFQVQLAQAGSELAIVAVIFAVVGLFGWRWRHADPETTAATLVRRRLSIGDLHDGILNAVRGNFLFTWAVRKIRPQRVSVSALMDQRGSRYFWPARAWHRKSFGDKLAEYVRAYRRDVEDLTEHLVNLASEIESIALSGYVSGMPEDAKRQYDEAIPDTLAEMDSRIPPADTDPNAGAQPHEH